MKEKNFKKAQHAWDNSEPFETEDWWDYYRFKLSWSFVSGLTIVDSGKTGRRYTVTNRRASKWFKFHKGILDERK